MQPIEFADILSTDLQLAHTGYLTHALCLEGTATLLFNGASFPLQRGDYHTHRDIAYYADQLCVTPKYLSETCKSISGSGAAYWINRYTSVEIARLLRDRSLTLTDIAYRFDFSSTAHLSRYIRQNLGISASEIRG